MILFIKHIFKASNSALYSVTEFNLQIKLYFLKILVIMLSCLTLFIFYIMCSFSHMLSVFYVLVLLIENIWSYFACFLSITLFCYRSCICFTRQCRNDQRNFYFICITWTSTATFEYYFQNIQFNSCVWLPGFGLQRRRYLKIIVF